MTGAADWFVRLAGPGDGRGRRVFGFPHAGAGCAQLAPLAELLADRGVETWSANLPGRQARLGEPPIADLGMLADRLAEALAGMAGEFDLLGYCGGALLAYEVARRLATGPGPQPDRLFVVSFEAPDIAVRPRRVPHLPSSDLWRYLAGEGGTPAGLAADPALRRLVEPAVRADFAALAGYRYEPGPPLPARVVVFHGAADTVTARGALLGWRRHSARRVRLRRLDGGHWLLDDAAGGLADGVAQEIADVAGP